MLTRRHDSESSKSILITGASSGIGEALALLYAAPGVTLFLSGRNIDRLRQVADCCRLRGAMVDDRIVDVCQSDAMAAWIAAADERAPLDLVIANAGISGGTGNGGEDDEQVREIFNVNLHGTLNTVLPALSLMTGRGRGQIALMASLAAFSGWPGAPAYGASKGAVRLYGEALRGAVAPSGIRVNVICPGFVESRMTAVNNYTMPFLMNAEKAACIIARGLARNSARIAFPWQSYAMAILLSFMPGWANALILKNLPKKPSRAKNDSSF